MEFLCVIDQDIDASADGYGDPGIDSPDATDGPRDCTRVRRGKQRPKNNGHSRGQCGVYTIGICSARDRWSRL